MQTVIDPVLNHAATTANIAIVSINAPLISETLLNPAFTFKPFKINPSNQMS